MAIEQNIVELINADVDGEISEAERGRLRSHLQSHPDAQKLHHDLAGLCQSLDSLEAAVPPPHLRHLILDSVKAAPQKERSAQPFWKSFLVAPPLHYAGMFAAGSLVTFMIVSSNQIAERAFDDVTELVGTISSDVDGTARSPDSTINLTNQLLAGTVRAHRAGPIMVIDFDLTATEAIEIVAVYSDRDIWFNGFAQLEADGTSVSAEIGRVSLRMSGKRRYAMYLHNAGTGPATVNLQFLAADKVIYEDDLTFGGLD